MSGKLGWFLICLAILVLFLASCGHRVPTIETQEVKVPIPVPCVDGSDIPPERTMATDGLVKDDTIFDKAKALLIDKEGLESDNKVMRALLVACEID